MNYISADWVQVVGIFLIPIAMWWLDKKKAMRDLKFKILLDIISNRSALVNDDCETEINKKALFSALNQIYVIFDFPKVIEAIRNLPRDFTPDKFHMLVISMCRELQIPEPDRDITETSLRRS